MQKGQQQSATLAAAQKAADVLKVSESLELEVIILLSSTWGNSKYPRVFCYFPKCLKSTPKREVEKMIDDVITCSTCC